jgi:hypothetical protein
MIPKQRAAITAASAAAVLLALVVAAVLLQWRALTQLARATNAADEALVLRVHEVHSQYLLLREAWSGEAESNLPADRLIDFGVRAAALRDVALTQSIEGMPGLDELLQRLGAFTEQAAMHDAPGAPVSAQALREQMRALADPLAAVVSRAGAWLKDGTEQRTQAVAQQLRRATLLTLLLAMLAGGLALISLRQLQRAARRQRSLEELDRKLRAARDESETARAARSRFLADMSHEIRTPFQGLLGMLALLRESTLAPRQADYVRSANEAADQLLATINDLLDLSLLETAQLTPSLATVELRALLRDVESIVRPQAIKKALGLQLGTQAGVPEAALLDGARVCQVLASLLLRAVRASDQGQVALELRRTGERLEFVVSDSQLSEGGAAPVGSGAGLSLELAEGLARLMGGEVGAREQTAGGGQVVLRLPLREAGPLPEAPAASDATVKLPGLRVLVAEDHPVNRQYLEALLQGLGHQAYFASDGEAAVRAVRESRFDVVLMDLHMPVQDGVAATRAIRALPDRAAAAVPIFALTADALPDTRERCLLAGMNGFLTKPINAHALAQALRRLFGTPLGPEGAVPRRRAEPPPLPQARSVIDREALAQALDAMPRERLTSMLSEYFGELPAVIEQLRAALRDAQPHELSVTAHAARGAALNLGLSALASTAEVLQQGAANLPAHEIARLVQHFEDQVQPTRAALADAGFIAEVLPTR